MHSYNLGYRFKGENVGHEFVEGFTGTALTGEIAAYGDAILKVRAKCEAVGEAFVQARLVLSDIGTTTAELMQLRDDWKVSAKRGRA